ncbi:uncharacterized protein EAF01_005617 [Botrytis porri]|uniref:uncharacterized protein n=1 Tax=Botrytis porri TaxID=87229 RepID=UPI0019019B95|nr:uncharacterized protein EAF01_005617 [Botrytis porri]KAF7905096.1 hypothetical protein EAF01_005617 [Botrytis porri]
MPKFFGTGEHKAAKSPATTAPSSNIRPQQKRRHSDQVKSGSSPRPSILASKTWHTSSTGEPRSKLPKSQKQKERVIEFFRISRSPDDKDDEGYDIKCRGIDAEMLMADKGSSSRENESLQPAQRRVLTGSRSMVKTKNSSNQSSSQDSPAPRKAFAPSTIPKSPYPNSSSDTSFLEPRSRRDVCNPRDRTDDPGAVSDPEYRRGRDGSNSRRSRERERGESLPSRDRNGKSKPSHQPPRASADQNYSQAKEKKGKSKPCHYKNNDYTEPNCNSSRNEQKLPSGRRENPKDSPPKAARTEDQNRYVARVPTNGHKPRSYQVHDYKGVYLTSLNDLHRGYERGQ